jgi:hypothetical protein
LVPFDNKSLQALIVHRINSLQSESVQYFLLGVSGPGSSGNSGALRTWLQDRSLEGQCSANAARLGDCDAASDGSNGSLLSGGKADSQFTSEIIVPAIGTKASVFRQS